MIVLRFLARIASDFAFAVATVFLIISALALIAADRLTKHKKPSAEVNAYDGPRLHE